MKLHHTKNKGDYGVLKAQLSLYEQGYSVLFSVSEHEPFDLVAYKDGEFNRVQVKYRAAVDGKISLNMSTWWADQNGLHSSAYNASEVDTVCIYCPDTDKCYFIDVASVGSTIRLRLNKPKNNQVKGITMADDYLLLSTEETTGVLSV